MLHTICFFFFNDTATTEIYTLSLHDALPIWLLKRRSHCPSLISRGWVKSTGGKLTRPHMLRESEVHGIDGRSRARSEERTSELQSRLHLVCRLLLEKKNHHLRLARLSVSDTTY